MPAGNFGTHQPVITGQLGIERLRNAMQVTRSLAWRAAGHERLAAGAVLLAGPFIELDLQ